MPPANASRTPENRMPTNSGRIKQNVRREVGLMTFPVSLAVVTFFSREFSWSNRFQFKVVWMRLPELFNLGFGRGDQPIQAREFGGNVGR